MLDAKILNSSMEKIERVGVKLIYESIVDILRCRLKLKQTIENYFIKFFIS